MTHCRVLNQLCRREKFDYIQFAWCAVGHRWVQRYAVHTNGTTLESDEELRILHDITAITKLQARDQSFERLLLFRLSLLT